MGRGPFTVQELDAMTEDERYQIFASRVITDLSQLPRDVRERIEREAAESIERHRHTS